MTCNRHQQLVRQQINDWHDLCTTPQTSNASQVNANLATGKASLNSRVVRLPVSPKCLWLRGLPVEHSAAPPAVSPVCFRYRPLQPGCLNSGKGEVFEFRLPGRNGPQSSARRAERNHTPSAACCPHRPRQPHAVRVRLTCFLVGRFYAVWEAIIDPSSATAALGRAHLQSRRPAAVRCSASLGGSFILLFA